MTVEQNGSGKLVPENIDQVAAMQPHEFDTPQPPSYELTAEDNFASDGVTPRIQDPAKAEFMAREGDAEESRAAANRIHAKQVWGNNSWSIARSYNAKAEDHQEKANELEDKAGRAYDKRHGNEEAARDFMLNGGKVRKAGRMAVKLMQSVGDNFAKDQPVQQPEIQFRPTWGSHYGQALSGRFSDLVPYEKPPQTGKRTPKR